jgi:1-acyl-sn-glycerol-3-phosphate acyltransferase
MTGMPNVTTILLVLLGWIVAIAVVHAVVIPWLSRRPAGDPVTGLLLHGVRLFCRLAHRVRFEGVALAEAGVGERGLIVVSNHTGAIDPLLLQTGCPFHIRWMMASDMMTPSLDWLWRLQRAIAVERNGGDTSALREAIRHVQSGGVIGIFPEGRIVTPPRRIWPFLAGVGLMVARCGSPVLLVWISGTPDTNTLTGSLLTPSHARVVFVERLDFTGVRDANAIAQRLRRRLAEVSGWPLVDEVPSKPQVELDPFAA